MKTKCLTTFFFIIISSTLYAQDTQKATQLIEEGIVLHDQGKYPEALVKYREALAADAGNQTARYEMTYTFMAMEQYDSCIAVSEALKKDNPSDALLKQVYVTLGSSYDYAKQPEKAIKIYNEGIKKFKDFYLLYFNQGVTYLLSLDEKEKAEAAFQKAVMLKPTHASSHYWLYKINKDNNKIPSILAASMVCILESQTKRSAETAAHIVKSIEGNVKKDGNNTDITLFLPPGSGNPKKNENDFSFVDLGLSLMAAAPLDDSLKLDTENKKLSFNYQMLCGLLENSKKYKGFYWKYYAPFFYQLKEAGYTEVVVNLVLQNNNNEDATLWVQSHSKEIERFSEWFKNFLWQND
jgi:tetratricopeptide (TPR) repeat protein